METWLLPAFVGVALLAAFHIISRVWLNWEIASNPAAQLSHGSWIGLWWRNNPFIERKAYMLFATFGFGWVFAALSWRTRAVVMARPGDCDDPTPAAADDWANA